MEQSCEPVLQLVRHFEGWSARAYRCPAGKWTIGYGHCCPEGHPPITREQGEAYLRADMERAAGIVARLAPELCSEPECRAAALASFVFNVGEAKFAGSTLLKKVRARDWNAAADEFLRWDKATVRGEKTALPGLARRRKAERQLFLTGELVLATPDDA